MNKKNDPRVALLRKPKYGKKNARIQYAVALWGAGEAELESQDTQSY
jgi:hypothetical protein